MRVVRNPHSSQHKPEQCVVQGAGCDSDEHAAHLGYPKLLELRVASRGGTAGPIRVIGGWPSHDRQAQRGGRPIETGRRACLTNYRATATATDPEDSSRARSDASLLVPGTLPHALALAKHMRLRILSCTVLPLKRGPPSWRPTYARRLVLGQVHCRITARYT